VARQRAARLQHGELGRDHRDSRRPDGPGPAAGLGGRAARNLAPGSRRHGGPAVRHAHLLVVVRAHSRAARPFQRTAMPGRRVGGPARAAGEFREVLRVGAGSRHPHPAQRRRRALGRTLRTAEGEPRGQGAPGTGRSLRPRRLRRPRRRGGNHLPADPRLLQHGRPPPAPWTPFRAASRSGKRRPRVQTPSRSSRPWRRRASPPREPNSSSTRTGPSRASGWWISAGCWRARSERGCWRISGPR